MGAFFIHLLAGRMLKRPRWWWVLVFTSVVTLFVVMFTYGMFALFSPRLFEFYLAILLPWVTPIIVTPIVVLFFYGLVQYTIDLENKSLILEQLASEDSLTKVASRWYFLKTAEQAFIRAKRLGSQLSIVMIDLDHFKSVNDQHGHAAGDIVLQHFACIAQSVLREMDVIGRVGGEEFAMLIIEGDVQQASAAAERLRAIIEQASVHLPDQTVMQYTASFGVATSLPSDERVQQTIDRADRMLYKAKRRGRNCVVSELA